MTVRKVGSPIEKTVAYDSSTRWVSQEHGSEKVNNIDASQVKDGDRVICTGTWGNDGVLPARGFTDQRVIVRPSTIRFSALGVAFPALTCPCVHPKIAARGVESLFSDRPNHLALPHR